MTILRVQNDTVQSYAQVVYPFNQSLLQLTDLTVDTLSSLSVLVVKQQLLHSNESYNFHFVGKYGALRYYPFVTGTIADFPPYFSLYRRIADFYFLFLLRPPPSFLPVTHSLSVLGFTLYFCQLGKNSIETNDSFYASTLLSDSLVTM